jgi:hypothetical protein
MRISVADRKDSIAPVHEGPAVYCPTNGRESSGDIWQSSIAEVMQSLGD